MRILASALCDRAAASPEGKLDIHGAFHDLYAPGFPARQERMVLVLVLEWDRTDSGHYTFRVDVTGPRGRRVLTVEGRSEVAPRPGDRPPPRTRLVMPLEDVVFPERGRYDFRVTAKGRKLKGPVLYLIEAEGEGRGGGRAGATRPA